LKVIAVHRIILDSIRVVDVELVTAVKLRKEHSVMTIRDSVDADRVSLEEIVIKKDFIN